MSEIEFSSGVEVSLVDSMGTDEAIIKAAKVSTLSDELDSSLDQERFLDYLMRNRHMSPFEQCSLKFRIDAPIFVWREFMRHRTFSYNEQSGRYTKMRPKFYIPSRNRKVIQVGKVGDYEFEYGEVGQVTLAYNSIGYVSKTCWDSYTTMLNNGIAKEVARMVLPVNIYSTAYVSGNLRNWLHFLSLRTQDEGATIVSKPQAEIEMVARQIEAIIAEKYPHTYAVWTKHGRQ